MLQNVLLIAVAVVAGAVSVLKIVAPKTKTLKDDVVLAKLEALEALVANLTATKAEKAEIKPEAKVPLAPAK